MNREDGREDEEVVYEESSWKLIKITPDEMVPFRYEMRGKKGRELYAKIQIGEDWFQFYPMGNYSFTIVSLMRLGNWFVQHHDDVELDDILEQSNNE